MATRWFLSIDLMNAEILDAQVVIVVVLHVGEAALRTKIRESSHCDKGRHYVLLPPHLGSFARRK
jgi:hypothetical protein